MRRLLPAVLLLPALALGACTNPYDPGQRALGGAALGAGTGAIIGSASGNAGAGAVIGGALGAVAGAATTPQPYGYAQPAPRAYYAPPPPPPPAYRGGYYDRWGRWHPAGYYYR